MPEIMRCPYCRTPMIHVAAMEFFVCPSSCCEVWPGRETDISKFCRQEVNKPRSRKVV